MWKSCYPNYGYFHVFNFRTVCSCLSWGNSMTLRHICETISKPCWLYSKTHGGQVQKQGCYGNADKNKNIASHLSGILLNCHCNCCLGIINCQADVLGWILPQLPVQSREKGSALSSSPPIISPSTLKLFLLTGQQTIGMQTVAAGVLSAHWRERCRQITTWLQLLKKKAALCLEGISLYYWLRVAG